MLNNNVIKFNFNHLASSNVIYLDGPYEEKEIKIKNASHYIDTLKKNKIILNQEDRKFIISENLRKILKKNNCHEELNSKLLDEVVNLVEKPCVLKGNFKQTFLELPPQLLDLTMQQHQKYFPMKLKTDNKHINYFLFVSNNTDVNNLILKGNEEFFKPGYLMRNFFGIKIKNKIL